MMTNLAIPPIGRCGSADRFGSRTARDEAGRSAILGASSLMLAAEAIGLAAGPMVGCDARAVVRAFALRAGETPAVLVAVGRDAPGSRPRMPRCHLAEIPDIA